MLDSVWCLTVYVYLENKSILECTIFITCNGKAAFSLFFSYCEGECNIIKSIFTGLVPLCSHLSKSLG